MLAILRLRNLGRKERGDTPLGAGPDAVDRLGGQRTSTLGFSDVATGDRPRQAAPDVALRCLGASAANRGPVSQATIG